MTATSESPLDQLSRADLGMIGRELMLAAHLQDRVSVPAILGRHSMEEAHQLAIDEWMMASPVYTQRLQRLLGFEGDDVTTIFKGLQLDVGFAHQFMDVGYDLQDRHHGEFWLRSCGALADVLPMGDEMVRGMCHDIEDPTFDATAVATNPRARVRPLHRPPGVPRGGPDCHWTVAIDAAAEPTQAHPWLDATGRSVVARLPNDPGAGATTEPGGWDDYQGPFDPHFELEHLSHRALKIVLREFSIQGHLLARSMMTAIDRRYGPDEAREVGRAIFVGIGWVTAERIARALDVDPTDADAFTRVLPLTHFLLPTDYVGLGVEQVDAATTTITLSADAAGLTEGDPYSLPGLLADGADDIVESLVHGVDPSATVAAAGTGTERRWTVRRDEGAPPAEPPSDVRMARFSTGVTVALRRRTALPDVRS
jgi:hypothetical protein